MTHKHEWIQLALLLAVVGTALGQGPYNFFPPPGITYTPTGGMAVGSPSGGVQGVGTINAQNLYVNGVAVATSSGSGSVTSVSVATANGLSGTVANPTTTPAITLASTFTGISYSTGTGFQAAIASNFPTLNQSTTGNAATATTAGSLSGTPTLCASGQAAQGVLANGNATGCITPISIGNEPASNVFIGPTSGSPAQPTFRLLQGVDLPLSSSLTWTGNVTFTPSSGVAMTVNGTASSDPIDINVGASQVAKLIGSATSGASDGLEIAAGTGSGDNPLIITNRAGSANIIRVYGDGGTVFGSASGGDEGAGIVNAQGLYINGVSTALPSQTGNAGKFLGTNGTAASWTALPVVPTLSYALITTSGSACSVNATWENSNFGSCVRNSTGNYTINFTTPYSGPPICTGNAYSGSPVVISPNGSATNSISFLTYVSSTGSVGDGYSIALTCTGT